MKVKELKKILKDLPDDMPVGLLDMTTDSFHDSNYPIDKEHLVINDYTDGEGGEIQGDMLFIVFENKLNENPI